MEMEIVVQYSSVFTLQIEGGICIGVYTEFTFYLSVRVGVM